MKITVGIPFLNNAKTLPLAIKSVINQTYKNWELLLINDGSTDESVNIAQCFVEIDDRVKLIDDGLNRGLIFRLNQIIELSNSDYIARMDSDDIMMPNRLESQIKIFDRFPNLDIVATGIYTIDENNIPIGKRDLSPINQSNLKQIFFNSLLVHPSILVKKSWYAKNRYNKKYLRAEDFELWCRTYKYTSFYRIQEPLLIYREGNINVNNYILTMKSIRKFFFNNFAELGLLKLLWGLLLTYLKSFIYWLAGFFKIQYILSKNRNLSITSEESLFITDYITNLENFNKA